MEQALAVEEPGPSVRNCKSTSDEVMTASSAPEISLPSARCSTRMRTPSRGSAAFAGTVPRPINGCGCFPVASPVCWALQLD